MRRYYFSSIFPLVLVIEEILWVLRSPSLLTFPSYSNTRQKGKGQNPSLGIPAAVLAAARCLFLPDYMFVEQEGGHTLKIFCLKKKLKKNPPSNAACKQRLSHEIRHDNNNRKIALTPSKVSYNPRHCRVEVGTSGLSLETRRGNQL